MCVIMETIRIAFNNSLHCFAGKTVKFATNNSPHFFSVITGCTDGIGKSYAMQV